jgi:predicted dehydrogenase
MRFAFAGLGEVVHSLHLPALGRIKEGEAVGGCDPAEEQRTRFEQETGLPAYESLAELIDQTGPDVVIVATPPGSHPDLCIQALRAGAHVLCEKPLATSLAESEPVLAEAERAGRILSIHHEFREQPTFRALLDRLGSDDVGPMRFCQITQLLSLAPWDEPAAWRADAPHQALLEGGIHLVDLMLVLFGERPDAVYARRSSGDHERRDADALFLLTLEFSGGRLGQLTMNRLHRGGDRYAEIRADCEQATLRASWGGRALLEVGKKRGGRAGVRMQFAAGGIAWEERGLRRRTLARDPRRPELAGTEGTLRKLIEAVEDGREPPSPGSQAITTLEVIEAAYRSATTGERVALTGSGG